MASTEAEIAHERHQRRQEKKDRKQNPKQNDRGGGKGGAPGARGGGSAKLIGFAGFPNFVFLLSFFSLDNGGGFESVRGIFPGFVFVFLSRLGRVSSGRDSAGVGNDPIISGDAVVVLGTSFHGD